ncbi:hypothetical protein ZWY2020_003151 [Hordeum vulgare]|nr:hypothetical protein ZWY2020_003151 [Hordeum vulgare]
MGDYSESSFSWVVSETAPLVFSVPFPFAEIFNVCTRGIIKCPINKFLICIKKAKETPNPVPPLERVWIYIFGLPKGGKGDHILEAVSDPVGKLPMVIVDSMVGDGSTRVEILCLSLEEVHGLSLLFYFGRYRGVRITYKLDLDDLEARMALRPPPPPPSLVDAGLGEMGASRRITPMTREKTTPALSMHNFLPARSRAWGRRPWWPLWVPRAPG